MKNKEIKFKFDIHGMDEDLIERALKEMANSLNSYAGDGQDIYHFKDVSNQTSEGIEKIINDFFDFTFNDIANVSPYKFLILTKDHEITVLANIHSSISNRISIDYINQLFNNPSITFYENSLNQHDINSKRLDEAKEFFNVILSDVDEVNELLSCVGKDKRGGAFCQGFDVDSCSSFLKDLSIDYNQFFSSVFAYTLSKFTGSAKVLFKLANINEDSHQSESADMSYSTSPVLMDCTNQEIDSFLKYSSNLINSVIEHSHYPLYLLEKDHDLSCAISFYYGSDLLTSDADLQLKQDFNDDLSFQIFDCGGDKFEIMVLFCDKFSKEFIERFVKSFELISKGMIGGNKLSDINYTGSDDLKLLDSYNRTEHSLKYSDILDAFNDNLVKYPNNNLVSYGDVSYTYGEGAFVADKLAKQLVDLGVEKSQSVAFLVECSELYMFSVLGILSMGGVSVPLDVAHPDERIQFILNDTESKVVIVSDNTYERANNLTNDNVTLLNISDIVNGEISPISNLPVVNNDLASILYTSGTTGIPKGVKITRKAIINLSEFYVKNYGLCSEDVFGLFSSIGFDAAFKAIFSVIYAGACLDVIPTDVKLDMNALSNHFIRQGINHADITTQVAKLLINQVDNLPLDVLFTGGEKLGEFDKKTGFRFVDGYGPTEAYVEVATADVADRIDSSSVGHLIDNIKAYILDNEFRRVPIGAVGELYLAGYQIADGYLNRKKETNEAFLNNPFNDDEDYNVMYRTGDLVRVLPDGTLGIVGRNDGQVKIRGNRVELSEIESVIRKIDVIEDVTVQTIKNGSNNELVAYVVASGQKDNLEDYVSDYVAEHKPVYMVPSFIVQLDEIPLNVNGKVDKRALPDVDMDRLHTEYVAPKTETEKLIVKAFENVFAQDRIGIYDDFVRLGGDSLTAIKLLSYLGDYNIAAAEILSLRTPYAIAKSIKETSFDLELYSLDGGCPLSEPQLNVYLDIVANDKADAYHIPSFIKISKEHDVDAINGALDTLIDAHPILGMCVSDEFDVPYLVKGSKPSINVESDVNKVNEFLTKSFDLKDSLCRFLIVENEDSNDLFAVFHHIIFDALSDSVFKEDLLSILDGKSVSFEDSFLKVPAFNNQIQNTGEYSEAEKFYESMLADSDEVGILLGSVVSGGSGFEKIDLGLDFNLFKLFLDKHGVSENILFTSAFAYTLSRFAGNDKVLFNIIENGRDRFNNIDSIGMFVNTLPILADCKNRNVSSFLKDISSLVYGVMKYNYYPFRLLANKYDITSDILFQYMPDWVIPDELFDETPMININDLINDVDDSTSDLSVNVVNEGQNYIMNLFYSDKYSEDFIKKFAKSYKLILHEMLIADMLGNIDCIGEEDIKLLDEFNQNEHPLEYEDILDAFNDNLSKHSDNNLVSFNDVSYTYGEGAFIAGEIAESLKGAGVGKNDCVAFLVERSELYMFTTLAILSVGAVFVPLDDTHPDSRIQFMVEDTNAKAVIVSDETYGRAEELSGDSIILNISDIVNDEIGNLSSLPVVYSDLACILYTSGTTGIPKGVKITRKAINNYANSYVEISDMNSDDVFALYASIGFDVGSVKSICVSIYTGACLNVVPNEIRLNLLELNKHFIDHNVTHANLPTQVAKLFINEIVHTSLKVLVAGGEKLGETNTPFNYRFIDAYGPTECCVSVSAIDKADKIDSSSVGYLLNNLKAYVLDNELRRVPMGAAGELYIAGYQIADGYLNRDEETQKSFLKNPFDASEDYGVMYRTGDMVRILPDGSLSIVGRRDNQVKIRGNRVELSDVESVIREISFVDDVTVQTFKNNDNYELVAYVVVNEELEDANIRNAISSYVGERKPPYMIPSFVISLDTIPLNVNGKVDKRALPEVDADSLRVEYVAPTTENERAIVDAFKIVFNQKVVGLNDDFVRLGGDSIAAIRVISLLEKNDITCRARDILNYKTPYLIAQNVEKATKVSYDATEGEVDLLPIQSYFFDKLNNNYSQEYILKSKIDLDLDTLQWAFDELCNIHDMLRATYRRVDERVVQEILPLNTRICEIKEHIADDLMNTLVNVVKESRMSLDIGDGLVKFSFVRHEDDCYIVLVIHHLIVDGVSWSILIDDLTHILTQISKNKETNLLRPYPYKFWVNDVKSLVEDISDDERQHWIEVNNLLDDSLIEGNSKSFTFDVNALFDVDNILMLSEEEYLALSVARAYKKTYDENIIFNRESYGRDDSLADVSRTIGWFTTKFPIIVDVDNGYDNVSLMRDVYSIKYAFKGVNHLGLNYGSLIYNTHELEYKYCPVTFNFLSTEFSFENELFESINQQVFSSGELEFYDLGSVSHGISLNVERVEDYYVINGDYAEDTYLGDKFSEFVENIKHELEFLGNYQSDIVSCCLTESQLGVYLDEKVNDMGIAYSSSGLFDCGADKSVNEIKDVIHAFVERHPLLKGRVIDGEVPLLVCDSYPSIEVVDSDDHSQLIKPFDLNESLSRFYILKDNDSKFIFYDIHHMITDATSRTIIYKELELAFEGNLDDNIDLGFVYASRDSFDSKFENSYNEAREFFRNNFSEIDEINTLLDDVEGTNNGITLPIHGIREDVEEFCRECGITLANLFNAVFAYTYSRFTGSDKVYYNFTEHGRHEDYAQDSLGMYVRTIPLMVNCEDISVKDYLSNVSDLILNSMLNSIYPFRLLANEFGLNNNVLFEYNFDLNDVSYIKDEMIVEDLLLDSVSDILCVVNDLDDGYVVFVDHSDKYSNDTCIRFVEAYSKILIQMLYKEKLSDIAFISDSDVELLDSYNQSEKALRYDNVLEAFNDNLSKYPEDDLVLSDETNYTYEESACIIDRLNSLLAENDISAQDRVTVFVDRNYWALFTALSCLSQGVTYVPIDENYPDKRIAFMIEQSASKTVITTDTFQSRVDNIVNEFDLNLDVINISCLNNDIEPISYLDYLDAHDNDVACILYTSGTTGTPKAVQMTRLGILNLIEFYVSSTDFTSDDVQGIFASVGFDVSLEQFASVFTGGAVTYVPNDIRLDIARLNEYFIKYGVTHTLITTQVAKLFVDGISETSLKCLQTAGEKLGSVEAPEDYVLSDVYGPTEANYITSIDVDDKIDDSSVGFCNWNTKTYILDSNRRRVPFGAVGEIYLSGYQITKGYLDNPEANGKALFANPFDGETKGYEVMYKTGDLGRYLPDGSLGIVGRADSQVKIRGNRVELSEIEVTIRNLDHVEDVTVQTVAHDGNNELVAYVVVRDGFAGDVVESIQNYMRERKPEYMVPAFVVQLDKIPVNVNGKVDKRALPEVDMDSLRAEYIAPRNESEEIIVNAFEKVFNQEKISILDDFVVLGGDSLSAVKLLSLIDNNNISAADILSLKTPKEIAKKINVDYSFDLDIYSLDDGCPLSESQLNVYLDIISNDKIDSYLIHLSMNISKEYDVDEVFSALNSMSDVHPILEMCIGDEFDVPYLVKGTKPEITVKNVAEEDYLIEFLTKPFDLSKSLCRFLIVENDDDYSLFAVFHHIIFDGVSEFVFKHDLLAILEGQSIDLDSSFLKTSAFNQQIQNTDEYGEAELFYEGMLADSDEVNVLLDVIGADGPGRHSDKLNIDLTDFLSKNNINENVLFTSVFAYTLSRFAGSDKVLFNIIENGRSRFNNFDSIGMFVNTLPLLIDCKNQNVGSFMEYNFNMVYDVMKYNYYPFRLLAKKYDLNSDIIFQYFPNWVKPMGNDDSLDDLLSQTLEDADDLVGDFVFFISEKEDGYEMNCIYSEKFSSDFVERFVNSYKLILQEMTSVNELSEINYISSSDLMLLNGYNETEHALAYEDILDAFNDNLSRNPNSKLVSTDERIYSYCEGAYIADKIAKKLIELGVNPQDCVAFLTERCEYYLFAVLGIMSMGGVYVPLDDAHPDERLEFILNDTQSNVVIVSDETYQRASELFGDSILLNLSELINDEMGSLSSLPVVYGDLTCILYTSGTTGLPKGVKITRKSIVNLATVYHDKCGITNDDVYGLFSTIGFDAALLAMVVVLYSGACLSILSSDARLDIDKMNEYFIRHNVTHSLITTQVGKLFMETVESTSLNVLLVGGEKLGQFESPKDYILVDSYGPTESCVFVSSIENSDKIDFSSTGPLGYNIKGYVLDKEDRRVPIGAVGELCIAGYQIAEGYLNRPEENAKSFIENPFDDGAEYAKIYRTGDTVRILPDGSLGIVGRSDNQVKIRGNRLELSEVESTIRKIDYVEDVTVQTIKNGSNNELVAYVVTKEGVDNYQKDICEFIAHKKPEFMVPSFVIGLDEIPVNINGKVDKYALPEVDLGNLHSQYVAPTNKKEEAIVNAFEKVLNQENIGIHDNFINLGGDSLTAIKLLLYLEDYNVSASDILSFKTPKLIAENIDDDGLDLNIYSLETGCPLNEPQLNVYLDIVANDKFDSYIIPYELSIPKKYSIDDLSNALDKLIEVHPILKMRISDDFDVPYLVGGAHPSILIESSADDDFISKPFDLHDSLCRFMIVENGDNYSLFAIFHHLIFDGFSNSVFKRDLLAILNGEIIDVDDSFLEASAFNQQIQQSGEYDEAKKFYEVMLSDIEDAGGLLEDSSCEGQNILSISLDDGIGEYLKNADVNENVLFTGVFAYTLSRFVGTSKVLFNFIDNGRGRFSNFDAIGMYVNTLPIVVDCKNDDVNSFMKGLSDLIYDEIRYNFYPFRLLANRYNINSDLVFQYFPEWFEESGEDLSDIRENVIEGVGSLISDFSVNVAQEGNNFILNIIHSNKYSKNLVERFAHAYNAILSQILAADELSDIDYISEDDLKLLDTFNQTESSLGYNDIMDAFNDNLAKYPDKPLVSYYDVSYSYSQGAFIADKIAKKLVDLGVEVQDCVSFLVERSELYMFCILGIMSMGGVYVPLDDAHPDERLQFMIKDTDSKVIIVSDETYERAGELSKDITILNISSMFKDDIGTLSSLPVSYGDLTCILYTSGTTGLPKGVKITRKSIINLSSYFADRYPFDDSDVCGLYPSIGFDAASQSVFKTIYVGASLAVIPEDIKLDMMELNNYFLKHNVTYSAIPTQVAKLFMQSVDYSSLKLLSIGGEKLGDFENTLDHVLIDEFGPTEAFAFISSIENFKKVDPSSVGFLNYNTKAYILDNELRQVPIGAVGELYLAGYQIADGYLNREDENIKSFLENPFENDEEYIRLYKTGDMVRLLSDGSLGVVGRWDSQVKIRGNRVELSEIESVIREIDYVEDVTVQTVVQANNHELVAYVVIDNDGETDIINSIKDYVGENKPNYMIPSFVITLDEIPLNVNGKVDKHALPDVDLSTLTRKYVAPRTETEKIIVDAFEKIFNQDKISLFDDYIRLGGDSIKAIRLVSLLQKNNIRCSVQSIFAYKTPFLIAYNAREGYSFNLAKKGTKDQNMFLIPPQGGLSVVFKFLLDSIEFEGNIYLIDDFKYDLSLDEIKGISDSNLMLEKYYDAIKEVFQDGDIIVGYSLGCIYAALLCEKLEKEMAVDKCILIDGPLSFVNHEKNLREEVIEDIEGDFRNKLYDIDSLKEDYTDGFVEKLIEVCIVNSQWDFNTPKINSHVVYLSATEDFRNELDNISSDNEYIPIEATHKGILCADVGKITRYIK